MDTAMMTAYAYSYEYSESSESLTTIFTPPSSCRTHWTFEGSFYNSVSGGLLMQNALASPLDTDCFPSGFANQGRESESQIYSPGYCPVGYTTPAQYLNDGTTTAVCCMSSFTYLSTLTTIDNYEPASTVIFAGCISTYPRASGMTAVIARANNTELQPTTISGPVTMWGQPIQVAFQAKDLSLFTTRTATPRPASASAQPSSRPSVPATATSTSSPLPATSSDGNTLSTGTKVGIGLGAVAIALVLFGLAGFLLWRRRKRRARQEDHFPMGPVDTPKEKPTHWRETSQRTSVLPQYESHPSELHVPHFTAEVADHRNAPVAEMESSELLAPRRPS